jgi:methylenetetrahydrofolate dehydrogenase (NADP+)/methenyltetrahydrofolate cyclohydrolase
MSDRLMPRELTSADIVDDIETEISLRSQLFLEQQGERPRLLIVAPDFSHDGSQRYTRGKQKVGQRLGIDVSIETPTSLGGIYRAIEDANQDTLTHGTIVQLPLAMDLAEHTAEVLASVDPEKDVDGLGPESTEIPATAKAVDELLKWYDIDGREEHMVLIGLGPLVNKPLKDMWESDGARSVKGFDIDSDDLEIIRAMNEADAIISATGQPSLLTPKLFLPGTNQKVLIDVGTAGTAKEKGASQHGDISDELRVYAGEEGWPITPEKGGVGPLTIRALFLNLMNAAERQAEVTEQQRRLGIVMLSTGPSHPSFAEDSHGYDPYHVHPK